MKISLAIPCYNSSKYFLDTIKYSLNNNFVEEIVVNDDNSSDEEYANLLQIVAGLNTDKIKIFRNCENVGAFRNKYITVQKTTSNWIYLLDSDNHPFENTYDVLRSIQNLNSNICYSPSKLFCKHDESVDYDVISDYNLFGYNIIGIEESKDAIIKGTKLFDWFINTGNYFFNRQTYLDNLKEPFENYSNYKLYADTAAAFYFWLKNNGKVKIVEDFHYNHRLRSDCYWNHCGPESHLTVDLYTKMLLEL
jgi:glycosyltransferase involved in cell wall biosynthesis